MSDSCILMDEPLRSVERRGMWETSLALASDKFIGAGVINTVIHWMVASYQSSCIDSYYYLEVSYRSSELLDVLKLTRCACRTKTITT